jgi:hypothetical protein
MHVAVGKTVMHDTRRAFAHATRGCQANHQRDMRTPVRASFTHARLTAQPNAPDARPVIVVISPSQAATRVDPRVPLKGRLSSSRGTQDPLVAALRNDR